MDLNVKTISSFVKQAGKFEKTFVKNSKVLEKTESIFKKTTGNTNPFVMDAKAAFAKSQIENSLHKKNTFEAFTKKINENPEIKKLEYKNFKKSVKIEFDSSQNKEIQSIFHKINPINQDNIGKIKTEVSSFVEDPILKQKISDSKDPDELFVLLKSNINNIIDKFSHFDFYKENGLPNITPESERDFYKMEKLFCNRVNKFMGLFSPKSTNHEVLKFEEELKSLGIKDVNFSDDIEQAKLVKSAVEDFIKRKIPLPNSITVSPMLQYGIGGTTARFQKGGYIFLPTSLENTSLKKTNSSFDKIVKGTNSYKRASAENQEKLLKEISTTKKSAFSTKNPKHCIYHETAHTFQPTSLKSHFSKLTEDELKTAGEISIYAKYLPNGDEVMPEMFAKLMDGQQLTDKQMKLYLKLGGIIPQ